MEGCRRSELRKIVVLGLGNVATHLVQAFAERNEVIQIWIRSQEKKEKLNGLYKGVPIITSSDAICRNADYYIIAVADDAIASVTEMLRDCRIDGIVAHTSGSYPLKNLQEILSSNRVGVFYPLQTFSKDVEVDLSNVPFFIEGADESTTRSLVKLAETLTDNVKVVDSDVRGHLHVAAVFANNFANFMWDIADQYLKKNVNLDISVFAPLLQETLRKAIENGPHLSQTGPAIRNDLKTLDKHLGQLDESEAGLYNAISQMIIEYHHKKKEI